MASAWSPTSERRFAVLGVFLHVACAIAFAGGGKPDPGAGALSVTAVVVDETGTEHAGIPVEIHLLARGRNCVEPFVMQSGETREVRLDTLPDSVEAVPFSSRLVVAGIVCDVPIATPDAAEIPHWIVDAPFEELFCDRGQDDLANSIVTRRHEDVSRTNRIEAVMSPDTDVSTTASLRVVFRAMSSGSMTLEVANLASSEEAAAAGRVDERILDVLVSTNWETGITCPPRTGPAPSYAYTYKGPGYSHAARRLLSLTPAEVDGGTVRFSAFPPGTHTYRVTTSWGREARFEQIAIASHRRVVACADALPIPHIRVVVFDGEAPDPVCVAGARLTMRQAEAEDEWIAYSDGVVGLNPASDFGSVHHRTTDVRGEALLPTAAQAGESFDVDHDAYQPQIGVFASADAPGDMEVQLYRSTAPVTFEARDRDGRPFPFAQLTFVRVSPTGFSSRPSHSVEIRDGTGTIKLAPGRWWVKLEHPREPTEREVDGEDFVVFDARDLLMLDITDAAPRTIRYVLPRLVDVTFEGPGIGTIDDDLRTSLIGLPHEERTDHELTLLYRPFDRQHLVVTLPEGMYALGESTTPHRLIEVHAEAENRIHVDDERVPVVGRVVSSDGITPVEDVVIVPYDIDVRARERAQSGGSFCAQPWVAYGVRTDRSGDFSMTRAPGEYEIDISRRGLAVPTLRATVGPEGLDLGTITLPAYTRRLSGVVRDPKGRPLGSAKLQFTLLTPTGEVIRFRDAADQGGIYITPPLPDEITSIAIEVDVDRTRYSGRPVALPIVRAPQGNTLDLTVQGAGSVTVRVLDGDRWPLGGARAKLVRCDATNGRNDDDVLPESLAGVAGDCRFFRVLPGCYVVSVSVGGEPFHPAARIEVLPWEATAVEVCLPTGHGPAAKASRLDPIEALRHK